MDSLRAAFLAYDSGVATWDQLRMMREELQRAQRLFVAMGNDPDNLVVRGLAQSIDRVEKRMLEL